MVIIVRISFLAFAVAPYTRHVMRRVNLDLLGGGTVFSRDIAALTSGGVMVPPSLPMRLVVVPVGYEVVVRPVGATPGHPAPESEVMPAEVVPESDA